MISQRPSFILTLLLKATELILASSASNDLRQKNFEITEYFKPFGNCTIIVSIPKKVVHVLNQEVKNAPIIIFGLFSKQGEKQRNFKLDKKYLDFIVGPNFISVFRSNQYFIWATTIKRNIQQFLRKLESDGWHRLGFREVIVVELSMHGGDLIASAGPVLRMYYYNDYHLSFSVVGIKASKRWYPIDCSPTACLKKLQHLSKNASENSKYFWSSYVEAYGRMIRLDDLLSIKGLTKIQSSRNDYRKKHESLSRATHVNFVTRVNPRLSFVSCYDVKPINSGHLSALTLPFDYITWRAFCDRNVSRKFCVRAFVIICNRTTHPYIDLGCYGGNYFTQFLQKTFFTMEMIIPVRYISPWNNLLQVEGIQILIPFNLLDEKLEDTAVMSGIIRRAFFFIEVLERSMELADLPKGYTRFDPLIKIGTTLVTMIRPYFGIGADADGRSYGNGTLNKYFTIGGRFNNKSAFSECPVQPVSYRETKAFLNTLSTCDKIAFMDKEKNIDALVPFLNDNPNGVKYLKGNNDLFFTSPRRWQITYSGTE
ncbi:hypothetical protein Fcan01_22102 [Folsomia candida]|uniref:Uncharacterized protein n=1 Tax=Folsomia candida TaxID=158441 RepID=A0A226DE53_FOLCA|nr:hypothetical protein Fcan01_22102 [Folsomia candida]